MFYNQLFFLVCALLGCAGEQFEEKCGLEAVASTPLVREGLGGVKANQFPWHVAIFHRERDNQFGQICGGSLVRSNLVISAAHCFSNRAHSHHVNVEDYRIVAGVHSSSWNSTEMGRQQSEVGEVSLGEEYGASILNFEDDISIIHLKTRFTFSDTVRAVCLDLTDKDLYTRQTSPGSVGMVAGWGLTESGASSDSLNFLGVPVVARVECIDKLPWDYKSYFTSDKICAGFTNGTAVCQGDSGGGLVFPLQNTSVGPQRWYLRGVLSNAPTSLNLSDPCLANVFALYTNIHRHRMWLSTQMDDNLPRGSCRRRGSEIGVCRKYPDCPSAIEEAARGILPQLCLSSSPEVCCVESMDSTVFTQHSVESTCPPMLHSRVSQRKTGSKANDYCVDLAERLYPCQQNGSSWSRGDLCGPEPEEHVPHYLVFPLTKATPSEIQRYGIVFGEGLTVYLVSERWLLIRTTDWDDLLKEPARNITPPPEVVFSISRSVPQSQHLPGNKTNTIVLVEMDRPVLFSRSYRPVCLHTAQDSVERLALSRWDWRGNRHPAALLSQEECRRVFPPGSTGAAGGATDRHVCVTTSSARGRCGYIRNYLTASNRHRVACTQLLVGLLLDHKKEGSTCTELYLSVAPYIPWVESVVWP